MLDSRICPACGKEQKLNPLKNLGAKRPADKKPEPGELLICGYCGELSLFNRSLQLELATEEDFKILEIETPGFTQKYLNVKNHIKAIVALDEAEEARRKNRHN